MTLKLLVPVLSFSILFSGFGQSNVPLPTVEQINKRAASFNSNIRVPVFETTTNEISATVKRTIADANAALDRIAAVKPTAIVFQTTVRAMDDTAFQIGLAENRLSVIKETSTNGAVREAATAGLKELEEWIVGLDYREDVYNAIKAYSDTKP